MTETKILNVYIKKEFSRESSISQDSGISEIGSSTLSNIPCVKKSHCLDSINTEINIKRIKTETNKRCKTEKSDESYCHPNTSKLVINPFAINNKRVIPSPLKNIVRFQSKRPNSSPLENKLEIKRFKKENNSPKETTRSNKKRECFKKLQKQEDKRNKKCSLINVSSKTFIIKKCSIKIERFEKVETVKKNRSPKLMRGDRRINKNEYLIIPTQFLSLQPKLILSPCQNYTWRSIKDDDWAFLDSEVHKPDFYSGTFNEKIEFKGQIKCRNKRDGDTFLLITYVPKDIIEDEWMTIKQFVNMNFLKTISLSELNIDAKKRFDFNQ